MLNCHYHFQQSVELNASLVNISIEVDTTKEYAAAQFATVQTLHENATELNAIAYQVAVQQLQGKVYERCIATKPGSV